MIRIALLLTMAAAAQECTRFAKAPISVLRVADGLAQGAGPRIEASDSLIDRHIFGAMETAGVKPANNATDAEFLRRVSLDLTGRLPTRARADAFLADRDPAKREKLVDELLASPAWTDKWTMYFGDLFRNGVNFGRQRTPQERDALFRWTKSALAANMPYDRMARELITAAGDNSWDDGRIAFLSWAGLLIQLDQDRIDLQTFLVSEVFLGLAHMDCLLCHNGRGHLDDISLWARQTTRRQAWEMSSFFSRTSLGIVGSSPGQGPPRNAPWYMREEPQKADYTLGTSVGDRPARPGEGTIAPRYIFSGKSPAEGENYRAFFARELTADPQFARAAVNYIWKEFMALGLVEPANQFDPARLDPDNPPPAPWTLQPANPRLLNELAVDFAAGGFDLKKLMRQIVTSRAYQLSSSYDSEWKPEWEKLYARKFVRRLWAEEIHDGIAQSSGVASTIIAMELPGGAAAGGPGGNPTGGAPADPIAVFLDAFLRGNRVDQFRSGEFSADQALRLMNNPFVLDRIKPSPDRLRLGDNELIDEMYLSILGRLPIEVERQKAAEALRSGDRAEQAGHLAWALYNSAEFIYNH